MLVNKYVYFKEGYQFGPKTFAHEVPTSFYIDTILGREVNSKWNNLSQDENVGLTSAQADIFIDQYIRNNWNRKSFVPEAKLNENVNITAFTKTKSGNFIIKVTPQNTDFYKEEKFVNFVKVKNIVNGKTNWILYEQLPGNFGKQAIYIPTYKLGVTNYLTEYDMNIPRFKSLIKENNQFYDNWNNIEDVINSKSVQDLIKTKSVEEFEGDNMTESQELAVAKQGLKNILSNPILKEAGITSEMIDNMSKEEVSDWWDKICNGKSKFGR